MPEQPRVHEVRLMVLVGVALTDPTLLERLAQSARPSVTQIVSDDLESELESRSYVEWVAVSVL